MDKNTRPNEGELILIGSKEKALYFREYTTACLCCGKKKTVDFGNIRLCKKCAEETCGKECWIGS
ncbi:MAG: hypothetical protein FWE68_05355 [Defluviitaleaceae bacterium]|nr:hypothetical protein [Defluviitaleaceae bacterium]